MESYARSLVCRTINSPRRRRCKPSRQANRLRTFLISMTFLQINHLDSLPRKSLPPCPQLQTLSRVLHQTRSTTSSPFLEIWVPLNLHSLRRLHQICSAHNLRYNPNSSKTCSADWVAWLPPLRSLLRHRSRRKSRRRICWVSSRA